MFDDNFDRLGFRTGDGDVVLLLYFQCSLIQRQRSYYYTSPGRFAAPSECLACDREFGISAMSAGFKSDICE
jgi:hypothetical protein